MKLKSLPSRLFGRNSAAASSEILNVQGAQYERQVDCDDHSESLDQTAYSDDRQVAGSSKQNKKCTRQIHFSFVTEQYEELMDEAHTKAKEEKKKMKKERYKKVKKFHCGPFLFKETIVFMGHYTLYLSSYCAIVLNQYYFGSCPDQILKSLNVGKAMRATWKCLMLGVYNFALAYSTPITVAATFVPDFHPGRNRT